MGILNQAHGDLLKNRDLVDYYGDVNNNNFSSEVYRDAGSLFGSVKAKQAQVAQAQRSLSREYEDTGCGVEEGETEVADEELLADFS